MDRIVKRRMAAIRRQPNRRRQLMIYLIIEMTFYLFLAIIFTSTLQYYLQVLMSKLTNDYDYDDGDGDGDYHYDDEQEF